MLPGRNRNAVGSWAGPSPSRRMIPSHKLVDHRFSFASTSFRVFSQLIPSICGPHSHTPGKPWTHAALSLSSMVRVRPSRVDHCRSTSSRAKVSRHLTAPCTIVWAPAYPATGQDQSHNNAPNNQAGTSSVWTPAVAKVSVTRQTRDWIRQRFERYGSLRSTTEMDGACRNRQWRV